MLWCSFRKSFQLLHCCIRIRNASRSDLGNRFATHTPSPLAELRKHLGLGLPLIIHYWNRSSIPIEHSPVFSRFAAHLEVMKGFQRNSGDRTLGRALVPIVSSHHTDREWAILCEYDS